MADVVRIKRRVTGSPGAPASLANAEIAYNEVDHTLYYGEGTGGTGGSATVVVAIGGQGLASNVSPQMDGTAAAGSATTWTRSDHIHPTDTSRAPLNSPALTGTPTAPTVVPGTDNTTKLATTAFVQSAVAAVSSGVTTVTPGAGLTGGGTGAVTIAVATNGVTNALAAQMAANTLKGNASGSTANAADLTVAQAMTLLAAAPLNSPALTGTPLAPTAPNGTNTTQVATTAFVLAVRQDQQAPPATDVSWNSFKLTNLADPISAQDAATKNYVDSAVSGLNQKPAVMAATTGANITLSGTQTIDGIALVAGNRVLVKDQTAQATNGIYVVAASAWTRAVDMASWTQVPDAYVFVEEGATLADTGWVCTSDPGGTMGTTAITWVQFSAAGQILAGNGLSKTGNTLNVVGTANRIVVGASVDIAANYVGQISITTLGTVTAGTWNGSIVSATYGGLGASNLTGYLYGNGSGAATASTTIPNSAISGLGTMAVQNANAVAITGGTIDGVTIDGGIF